MKRVLSLIVLTVLAAPLALGQVMARPAADERKGIDAQTGEMGFYSPAEVKWKDGPGSLPAGAKFAVLEGDPAKEGPFVMRLRLPDGFRIQPHLTRVIVNMRQQFADNNPYCISDYLRLYIFKHPVFMRAVFG